MVKLLGWDELILATSIFFVSHAFPARPPVRPWLIRHIGKTAYLLTYSVLSILVVGWLIIAANRAPYVVVWHFSPWQTWVPNIVMPFVCVLIAFGIAAPNPLSIGSYNDFAFKPDHPGIVGVTRHPLLWAAALWAFAHAVPNGDLAHVLMFGLFGMFSLLGMLVIDARKKRTLGAVEWHRLSHLTSLLPLFAIVSEKWRLVLREIGLLRLAIAAVVYVGLLTLHRPVIGLSPLPPL
jgi:uncharacterized membrane protein